MGITVNVEAIEPNGTLSREPAYGWADYLGTIYTDAEKNVFVIVETIETYGPARIHSHIDLDWKPTYPMVPAPIGATITITQEA